jgi:16S rRNA (cytosine1407-C5)-methyltransferase
VIPDSYRQYLAMWFDAETAASILNGLQVERAIVFRRNSLRCSAADFYSWLNTAGFRVKTLPGFQDVFVTDSTSRHLVTGSALFYSGGLYVQNPSSMLAALLLQPQPDDRILDLTAAPGSKTQLLSVLMENRGQIAAVEVQRDRYYKLKANLERCGTTNTTCFLKDGALVGRLKPESFDRVLLDAPCSSESFFGSGEEAAEETWSIKKVKQTVSRQKMLFNSAVEALKPGGRLVYATCTINPHENEEMAAYALEKHSEKLIPVDVSSEMQAFDAPLYQFPGSNSPQHVLRIMPGPVWDGFFVAVFEKRNG